jgi:hypothetical protein
VREQIALHLVYLDDAQVAELWELIAWMHITIPRGEVFSMPGTCWTCDQDSILAVQANGNWIHHPGLDREVVLTHTMQTGARRQPVHDGDSVRRTGEGEHHASVGAPHARTTGCV